MHSRAILSRLNELYPSTPHVAYESPQLARLWPNLISFMDALEAIFLPRVAKEILNPASQEYFRTTREAEVGMSLEDLETQRGGEVAYTALTEPLGRITEQLGEDVSGPFFEGKDLAQVDLIWVGILLFIKRLGEDVFEEVLRRCAHPERHLGLLKAVEALTGEV